MNVSFKQIRIRLISLLIICSGNLLLACHQIKVNPIDRPRLAQSTADIQFKSTSYVLGYFEGGHPFAECGDGIESLRIFRSSVDSVIQFFLGGIVSARSIEVVCNRPKLDVDSLLHDDFAILKGVYFKVNSSDLDKNSFLVLDQLADFLSRKPEAKIRIIGHTDLIGDPKKNQTLSEERALSTKSYLLTKGIADSKIETVGLGSKKPLVPLMDLESSAMNRRIEVQLVKAENGHKPKLIGEPEEDEEGTEGMAKVILRNGKIMYGHIQDQTKDEIYIERDGKVTTLRKQSVKRIIYHRN
ncbi:hypothetical protein CH373_11640 [Leptospira perolatii]|uniref:OmpA-like domain-containing protein n=1 Tax=Leptospira perolatii TaxID=2023191 RepID=A0A2M9ZM21_9LEPT|nr:OmpA family protein [Leptospira perolatii]PJZ69116.1 hypothetical protein CH360_12625 [Leptospira perolatii]PJZ73140.1 hypothetical protein CH373_11640 [Leptospira perolatii]